MVASDTSEQFELLRKLSVARALDIMQITPSPEEHGKDFMRVLAIQQSVIASVLGTTARIEESKLRSQQSDRMTKVLAAMAEEEKRLALN